MRPSYIFLATILAASACTARPEAQGDLRRRGGPLERIPGVESAYGAVKTSDGLMLRTIETRPTAASGRLPGIYFVQWLSCDTVELPEGSSGGWSRMLRRVIQESGFVVWRTEKAGVGDSEGRCETLDYDTEVAHHRQGLEAFAASPHVDASRIVVFGASMGANMAPLVARGRRVAGVMTWGGGAKTWFERQLTFSRHAMELGGGDMSAISARMRRHARFYAEYLLNRRTPAEIRSADPVLGAVWQDITGVSGDLHFGRPVAFHQQAQASDWTAAWAEMSGPVLALYGEYDWFEDVASVQTVLRIVNRDGADRGMMKIIPRMDHHFSQFPSPEAAFRESGGTVNEAPAVAEMLAWLRSLK